MVSRATDPQLAAVDAARRRLAAVDAALVDLRRMRDLARHARNATVRKALAAGASADDVAAAVGMHPEWVAAIRRHG